MDPIWDINKDDRTLFADKSLKENQVLSEKPKLKFLINIDVNTSTSSTQPEFFSQNITPTSQNFSISPQFQKDIFSNFHKNQNIYPEINVNFF